MLKLTTKGQWKVCMGLHTWAYLMVDCFYVYIMMLIFFKYIFIAYVFLTPPSPKLRKACVVY